MHLGFALDLSDVDTWDIDLSDTDLGLLDADILSKHFVGLQGTSWRRLQYVFKTNKCLLSTNTLSPMNEISKKKQTTDG